MCFSVLPMIKKNQVGTKMFAVGYRSNTTGRVRVSWIDLFPRPLPQMSVKDVLDRRVRKAALFVALSIQARNGK